ncbi:phosphotransferase family protein [Amycolatopsis ultiminotia]|uniref:Phosphotransferase family protein n=1 Tax=Amycolatopsis ultiminotia TaxID=543629 RepID=A0ABP6V5W0_9PSEU
MVSESPPGITLPVLEQFLRSAAPGLLSGPLKAGLLSGGRSNLTYLLTDGRRRWVLRRPPLGHVLATAHDMDREYRVLAALHPTDVPVPRPLVSAGPDVLGAPFYVMEFADGLVLREPAQLAEFATRSKDLAVELADVLARLHSLDPAAVGLGDLGRPAGYLMRQLRRWDKQLAASRTRDLPELVRLGERLGRAVPGGQSPAIVHGDYRLDNVVVSPDTGRVTGVLDWEMATLGDPLTDLASMVMWWDGMSRLDSPVAAVPGETPGFAGSELLIDRYAESGRDLTELSWYLGFACYKIAVIFEGIHFRAGQGLTVGAGFDRLGALVPALAERGHAALAAR